jgi:hypothetical protein
MFGASWEAKAQDTKIPYPQVIPYLHCAVRGRCRRQSRAWPIKFSLEGQNYVLLTAMPTTRSEHAWVTHEPQYKLSQHMQGASDNRDMFMVRSLSRLLEEQSNPRPSPTSPVLVRFHQPKARSRISPNRQRLPKDSATHNGREEAVGRVGQFTAFSKS